MSRMIRVGWATGVACLLCASLAVAEERGASPVRGADSAASETKFGLTEAQRQAVFRDLAAADARATREAAQQFAGDPESEGQVAQADRLRARYEGEVAEKYQLDTSQLVLIQAEGYQESWPTGLP